MSAQEVTKKEPEIKDVSDVKAAMRRKLVQEQQAKLMETEKFKTIMENQKKAEEYNKKLVESGAIGKTPDEQKMYEINKEFEEKMRAVDQINMEQPESVALAEKVLGAEAVSKFKTSTGQTAQAKVEASKEAGAPAQ